LGKDFSTLICEEKFLEKPYLSSKIVIKQTNYRRPKIRGHQAFSKLEVFHFFPVEEASVFVP